MRMKIGTNELDYTTKLTTMPIYGKTFKILLHNKLTDDLETWYASLNTRVLLGLFKLYIGLI